MPNHSEFVKFLQQQARTYRGILENMFGPYETYRELTAATTDEPAWRFQEFHAEEIVQIINTLEEMPAGMHAIAEEDKKVRIEIELHALDGELEGAVHAFTRIFSEIGTFTDLYLYPVGVPRGTPGTVRTIRELHTQQVCQGRLLEAGSDPSFRRSQ